MRRTNITITDGLQTALQAIADSGTGSVAAEIERLLWDSPEVQQVAEKLRVTREVRKRRGERGRGAKQRDSAK